ncbi:hypothetical protein Cgig2_006604 [Carnegiea gigantea]|uniref:Endonuclease/exonuclease/phosphatase domain-containing protein n=1 Tax=Carnegiea gigantea TaxID=171969 RepID=A0A9Q1KQF6_9CARY|nr:hypothetical protein Cgig2_006604 [Carnegiea gigantea]
MEGSIPEGSIKNLGNPIRRGFSYRDTLQRNNPELSLNKVQNVVWDDTPHGKESRDDKPPEEDDLTYASLESSIANGVSQGSRFPTLSELDLSMNVGEEDMDEDYFSMNQIIQESNEITAGYQPCRSSTGSREFLNTLREHICMQQPHILALLEMHISGIRANERHIINLSPWKSKRGALDYDTLLQNMQALPSRIYKNQGSTPWLLAGDFNETRSLEEHEHRGNDMIRRCTSFANWIENNGLIDLGYSAPCFTWTRGNSWKTRKSAHLD